MKITFLFMLTALLTGLSCCSKETTTYYLEMSRSYGIYSSMPVLSQGIEVGEVTNIRLIKDKVIVEISVKQGFIICDSSKFTLANLNPLEQGLNVSTNCKKRSLYDGDTLITEIGEDIQTKHYTITRKDIDSIKSTYPLIEDSIHFEVIPHK